MEELFYQMIFKRKSFHLFRETGDGKISSDELKTIEEKFKTFKPLVNDIKTNIKIVPAEKVVYYNRIDIGIFLLFLEVCLKHENMGYERELFTDLSDDNVEETLVARYNLKGTPGA